MTPQQLIINLNTNASTSYYSTQGNPKIWANKKRHQWRPLLTPAHQFLLITANQKPRHHPIIWCLLQSPLITSTLQLITTTYPNIAPKHHSPKLSNNHLQVHLLHQPPHTNIATTSPSKYRTIRPTHHLVLHQRIDKLPISQLTPTNKHMNQLSATLQPHHSTFKYRNNDQLQSSTKPQQSIIIHIVTNYHLLNRNIDQLSFTEPQQWPITILYQTTAIY